MNTSLALPIFLPEKNWTPREREILEVLLDGNRHVINKLHDQTPEFYKEERKALAVQIFNIRTKLKGTGYEILCEFYQRKTHYRLVRLITHTE